MATKKFNYQNNFRIYNNYKINLIREKLDIISIATRTKPKVEIINAAFNSNIKGVHVEKPLSTNLKDCEEIINNLKENNVNISFGTYRRYMPVYRKAKEIILNGDIGEIYEIKIEHGKSNLMWTHPHSTDLINFYNPKSKIKYIQSSCEFDENDFVNNDLDSDPILNFAFIKYENDVNGVISSSNGMNTIINGTKGKRCRSRWKHAPPPCGPVGCGMMWE